MIFTTKNGATLHPVGLNYRGLLHALTNLQIDKIWALRLSKEKIFEKFLGYNPPEANRLSDFHTKICIPLEIPFYLLWVWLCTDFSIPLGSNPFESAEQYLRERLSEEDFLKVIRSEGPINFRKALRARRNSLGLSLAQMADKVGVKKDNIASLERKKNGTSMPRCDTLNKVLPFYGLHPIELYVLALKDEDPYKRPI